jgi:hypothetical protein
LHLPLTVSDGRSALGAFGTRLLAVGAALCRPFLETSQTIESRCHADYLRFAEATLGPPESIRKRSLRPPCATCGV